MINPKAEEELVESTRPSSETKLSVAEFVVQEIEASPSVFVMEEKVSLGEKGRIRRGGGGEDDVGRDWD